MEPEEALRRLGLAAGASAEDIVAAWRSQMSVVHPDSGSAPNEAVAKQINTAKDIALGHARSTAHAPAAVARELVRAAPPLTPGERSERASASDRTIRRVVMHQVGRAGELRRQRTALAIGAGGIAAVAAVVRATASADLAPELRDALAILLVIAGLAAALIGAAAGLVSGEEQLLEIEVEQAAETLEDRGTFTEVLEEIGLGESWTRDEMRRGVADWAVEVERGVFRRREGVPLRWTAGRIGPRDFTSLLLAKGLERNWLEEAELSTAEGAAFGYRRTYVRAARE